MIMKLSFQCCKNVNISGLHRPSQDVQGRGPLQVPRPPARQVWLRVHPRGGLASSWSQHLGHWPRGRGLRPTEAGDDDLRLPEAGRGSHLEDREAGTSSWSPVRTASMNVIWVKTFLKNFTFKTKKMLNSLMIGQKRVITCDKLVACNKVTALTGPNGIQHQNHSGPVRSERWWDVFSAKLLVDGNLPRL